MQKYYQNEPRFNGVYSRNNLAKIKDGACVINNDDYKTTDTHQIALYVNDDNVKKYSKKYLQNTSMRISDVWICLY